jgi:hypothetical protein
MTLNVMAQTILKNDYLKILLKGIHTIPLKTLKKLL